MLAIQKVALGACNEKLTAIGILAAIGHGQQTRRVMLQGEVLIRECSTAVDAQHPGTIAVDEVAALYHEIFDHSMEDSTFETQRNPILPVFTGAELSEILRRLRARILEQLEDHTTYFCGAHGYVEEDNRIVGISQLSLNLVPRRHIARNVPSFGTYCDCHPRRKLRFRFNPLWSASEKNILLDP